MDNSRRVAYPIREQTISELIKSRAEKFKEKLLFEYVGQRVTYAEFAEKTAIIAGNLNKLGIKKGDRVCLMMNNSMIIQECFYGIWRRGAAAVSLSTMFTEREVVYVINNSHAKMVICFEEFVPIIMSAKKQTPSIEKVIVTSEKKIPGTLPYKVLFEPVEIFEEEIEPDDLALISYTSGTTGKPKGAMLTNINLLIDAKAGSEAARYTSDDVQLIMLPLFHLFAITVNALFGYYAGASMPIISRFDLKDVFEAIDKFKVSNLVGVPTMYIYMYNYPEANKYDTASLRIGLIGGGSVSPDLKESFEKKFNMRLLEVYGQTETSPMVCMESPTGERRRGSMGQKISFWEVRIVDENDQDVPIGQAGELVVRGPGVMRGYFEMPEETEEAFRNGWHHTGDIARMDNDGFLYFVDRSKDMLITGGYNIYPKEIEDIIYTHPAILEVAVVGVPDEIKGDLAKAFIVKKQGQEVTAEEIMSLCRENLAAYKCPRLIEFIDALPKTPQGKITKISLREKERSAKRK